MAPFYEEEWLLLLTGLASGIPSAIFGIASYVLTAAAIYVVSRRRGLRKPWLAWIPVVNVWLLGSLSDQYQYVVRREDKSKRKWLLGLSLLMSALTVAAVVIGLSLAGTVLFGGYRHGADALGWLLKPVISLVGLALPLIGAAIAYAVIRFMALYDVYRSMDPNNAVLYLVLSVLFSPTEPFFLFFNRNKDAGMPPRRQEPVYQQEPAQEYWEEETKDYL